MIKFSLWANFFVGWVAPKIQEIFRGGELILANNPIIKRYVNTL